MTTYLFMLGGAELAGIAFVIALLFGGSKITHLMSGLKELSGTKLSFEDLEKEVDQKPEDASENIADNQ